MAICSAYFFDYFRKHFFTLLALLPAVFFGFFFLGFYSLRHSFASFCAEAGVPKSVVVSILGANSEIVDEFYTHIGEDAQRAAVEAISGSAESTPVARIKRALEYISSIPEPSAELLAVEKILKN